MSSLMLNIVVEGPIRLNVLSVANLAVIKEATNNTSIAKLHRSNLAPPPVGPYEVDIDIAATMTRHKLTILHGVMSTQRR